MNELNLEHEALLHDYGKWLDLVYLPRHSPDLLASTASSRVWRANTTHNPQSLLPYLVTIKSRWRPLLNILRPVMHLAHP